jgi:hypothetical protein
MAEMGCELRQGLIFIVPTTSINENNVIDQTRGYMASNMDSCRITNVGERNYRIFISNVPQML